MDGQVQNQNTVKNNEVKGRGLFYGVVAVATFIVMAVGATFAYFTATTSSGNSTVETGSTTLALKYIGYGAAWMHNDLIPADTTVAEYSFEYQDDTTLRDETIQSNAMCKDDFGNSICSVYVFQVYNSANSPQSVTIDVVSGVNGFSSLNAMAYELTLDEAKHDQYVSTESHNGSNDPTFRRNASDTDESFIQVLDGDDRILDEGDDLATQYSPIYVNRNGVTKTLLKYIDPENGNSKLPAIDRLLVRVNEENQFADAALRTAHIANDIVIGGGARKTFALVLYIKNENVDQTATDANMNFSGQVVVGSGDGSTGVSGTISAVLSGGDADLQSQVQDGGDEPNSP